jgi:ATP-dependent DNA helicase RecG
VFFQARPGLLEDMLPAGERRIVSGQLSRYGERFQIVHPELVTTHARLVRRGSLEPVYPLTQGVGANLLLRVGRAAAESLPELPEWQDPAWRHKRGWPGFSEALGALHIPDAPTVIEPDSPARARLAYDELLANQLALRLVRGRAAPVGGRAIQGDDRLRRQVLDALPFALTQGQRRVLGEIDADLAAPRRMLRLLQGDVGSGKTLLALLAMLGAVEAGHQAVLMAPTELLAAQHAATLGRLLAPAGLVPVVLTGRE